MNRHWTHGTDLLLGAWLVVSPWMPPLTPVPGSTAGMWSPGAAGLLLLATCWIASRRARTPLLWLSGLSGAWLTVSPWILHDAGPDVFRWNAVAAGTLVILLAAGAIKRADTKAKRARLFPARAVGSPVMHGNCLDIRLR